MQIQNRFEVPMSPPAAWSLLMDISFTAPCFPGAELLEKIDEDTYKGRVTVRLGPLIMVFMGNLHIENRNEATHSADVKATWTETKGRGNAVAVTNFTMQERGSCTEIVVDSDLQLAGQIAQYGRGTGMISELSAQLISKFAENLRAKIQAVPPAPGEAHAEKITPPSQPEVSAFELLWKVLVNRLKLCLAFLTQP